MDELEQLKAELAEARETNQRLNRRCQELEHQMSIMHRHHKALSYEVQRHLNVVTHWNMRFRS